MKNLFFTICIFSFWSFSSFAQIEATTTDGKKVLLNTNGTWTYAEKNASDTVSNSLSCESLISTEVDKVTGNSTIGSISTLVVSKDGGKNGFGIFFMKSSTGSIITSIKAVGAGSCIDEKAKMNILFRDGTRLELLNDTKFNCEGKYTLYFLGAFGKKKELEMLKTKEIETMRIWTSDSFVEQDFSAEQSQTVMMSLQCLSK